MRVNGACCGCGLRSSAEIESYREMDRLSVDELTWTCPHCGAEIAGEPGSLVVLLDGYMEQHPVGQFRRKLTDNLSMLWAWIDELDPLDLDIVLDDLDAAMDNVEAMRRRRSGSTSS